MSALIGIVLAAVPATAAAMPPKVFDPIVEAKNFLITQDGWRGNYSYFSIDTSPDAATGSGAALKRSSTLTACGAAKKIVLRFRRFRGHAITRVKVFIDHRFVLSRRGRSLRSLAIQNLAGTAKHRLRIYAYTSRRLARIQTRTIYGCGRHRPIRRWPQPVPGPMPARSQADWS